MPILKLVTVLIVSGLVLWFFNAFLPIDGNIIKLINVFILVFLILYIFGAFGLLGRIPGTSIEWNAD